MAPDNRPKSRQKTVVSGSAGVNKRGSGLGTGPVGKGSGGGFSGSPTGGPVRFGGRRISLFTIIIILVFIFGGRGISGLLGGSSPSDAAEAQDSVQNTAQSTDNTAAGAQSQSSASAGSGAVSLSNLAQLFGVGALTEYYAGNAAPSSGQDTGGLFQSYAGNGSSAGLGNTSYSEVKTEVAAGARDKRTLIKGNGEDIMTIMVYMCGTDLESKHGMATADLMEMAAAKLSDKLNILVYTGGCLKWQNNIVSNKVNQIYKVEKGGVRCLEKDMGDKAMTSPETLTGFIDYCTDKYPADRYELIFWDHGGGTISGYGYDEKRKNGSMTLAGIDNALKAAGTVFDFIGFDACLMATLENGLMLSQYADYMIASEETEPGVGWYYTGWLDKLSLNTSMPTTEIGKNIVDDFVEVCNKKCRGQKTTLSVTDLAELSATVPGELTGFAKAANGMIQNDEYKTVSDARYNTREFAQSSKIDQIDLTDFAKKTGTAEGKKLAQALVDAVKYNRTSSSISDAYGISAYFPLKKMSKVDQAADIYDDIGMDSEYTSCIKSFASLQLGGQAAAASHGAPGSPLPSLLGTLMGSSQGSSMMADLFTGMLTGSFKGLSGMSSSNTGFLSDRAFDDKKAENYIRDNSLDQSALLWSRDSDGSYKLMLSQDQWSLIHDLELNVFYDDGEGYVDLGLDNVFDYDDEGNLIGEYDNTWLTMNGNVMAYYHTDTVEEEDGSLIVSGYVPAFLNGERVELLLIFDDDNPQGAVIGARPVYEESDNDTVAKNAIALKDGDKLEFVCDYYSYEGEYQDSYYLGEPLILDMNEGIKIANMDIGKSVRAVYKLTDIYEQSYWTQVIP